MPNKKIQTRIVAFIAGALSLSFFSVFQKLILGADPFVIKGFIVPILFGGSCAILINAFFQKTKNLNTRLFEKNQELQKSLDKISKLENILPICSYCKKIRSPDSDPKQTESWNQMETYLSDRTNSKFSHGICPDCEELMFGTKK